MTTNLRAVYSGKGEADNIKTLSPTDNKETKDKHEALNNRNENPNKGLTAADQPLYMKILNWNSQKTLDSSEPLPCARFLWITVPRAAFP